MKKSELIALLNELQEENDIDEVILGNGFAKPITDVEGLNSLLTGNKEFQGLFDKKVTAGIENFKKNGMQKLIEAEVLKRTGNSETPEQKQIRELQERLDRADREKTKAERVAKFKDVATEKKIPSKLLDYLLADDDDTTNANLELFQNSMKDYIESEVKGRLGSGEYTPPTNPPKVGITKEQFSKMGYKERIEIYNNEPETYQRLIEE